MVGSNRKGKLGCGENYKESFKPQIVEHLDGIKIVEIMCGQNHTCAVDLAGRVFSWGEGSYGRLGLGYDEETQTSLDEYFPKEIAPQIAQPYDISCGNKIQAMCLKNGVIVQWGKGDHEKPFRDDYIKYSVP